MAFYNSINDESNFVISFTSNPQQDFGAFAKGYTRAASVLAEHILAKPHFPDYEAYPVVFLYRQAFELYLKGLYYKGNLILAFNSSQSEECDGINKHELQPLTGTFKKICKRLFPLDRELFQLAEKAHNYAIEFEQIDKWSFGYRYPIKKNRTPSTNHHQVVNLRAFHNSIIELFDEFENVNFGFDIEISKAQEKYESTKMNNG